MTLESEISAGSLVKLSKMQINKLVKTKEKIYFALSALIGIVLWGFLAFSITIVYAQYSLNDSMSFLIISYFLLYLIFIALALLVVQAYFFGNSVLVKSHQFPVVFGLVNECAHALGMLNPPHVFIIHGRGLLNAFALKIFRTRYVILHAEVVDFALKRGQHNELRFIISHELAHHVVGHVSSWRFCLTLPASITLFLPLALSRAREYTCDSIAAAVLENSRNSASALLMLAHGSQSLANDVNVEAFVEQEKMVPYLGGYIREIFQTHPRLTRRVQNVLRG